MPVTETQERPKAGITTMLLNLPETVLEALVNKHKSELEVKTLRVVSKECKSMVDTIVDNLAPKDFVKAEVSLHRHLPTCTVVFRERPLKSATQRDP